MCLPAASKDKRNFQPWCLSDQMWFVVLEVKLLALVLCICVSVCQGYSQRKEGKNHSQKCTKVQTSFLWCFLSDMNKYLPGAEICDCSTSLNLGLRPAWSQTHQYIPPFYSIFFRSLIRISTCNPSDLPGALNLVSPRRRFR